MTLARTNESINKGRTPARRTAKSGPPILCGESSRWRWPAPLVFRGWFRPELVRPTFGRVRSQAGCISVTFFGEAMRARMIDAGHPPEERGSRHSRRGSSTRLERGSPRLRNRLVPRRLVLRRAGRPEIVLCLLPRSQAQSLAPQLLIGKSAELSPLADHKLRKLEGAVRGQSAIRIASE